SASPLPGCHEDLRHLALEAGARVEKHAPANAGQARTIADGENDVLSLEARRDRGHAAREGLLGELGVVGVEGLLVLVELQQQRTDEVQLAHAQPDYLGLWHT